MIARLRAWLQAVWGPPGARGCGCRGLEECDERELCSVRRYVSRRASSGLDRDCGSDSPGPAFTVATAMPAELANKMQHELLAQLSAGDAAK